MPGTQRESVLLHQDLHADNVLYAGDRGWLAIDPKPLLGEKAFGLAPIIRSHELGHSREAVIDRLQILTRALDLDMGRVRGWAIAQTVAWAFEGDSEGDSQIDRVIPKHLDTARWLLDHNPQ